MALTIDREVRAVRNHVLARMAASGIYLVRGVPRDLQRTARGRAMRDGTSLGWVLLQALRAYAAGTWKPTRDVASTDSPLSKHD